MRKMSKSRKAVSTVIATILMIMITMVGMTILFTFVSIYADNYKKGIGSSVMESLTIEDICLNSTGQTYNNQAKLWIYNTGEISANVTAIYVNGLAATNGTSNINFNINIPVNAHVPITIQVSAPWKSAVSYDFKVTTLRGSSFENPIQAP